MIGRFQPKNVRVLYKPSPPNPPADARAAARAAALALPPTGTEMKKCKNLYIYFVQGVNLYRVAFFI